MITVNLQEEENVNVLPSAPEASDVKVKYLLIKKSSQRNTTFQIHLGQHV